MLRWFDGDHNLSVAEIPHRDDYDLWLSRLTNQEQGAIFRFIKSLIRSGSIHTSSWMPGPTWTDTPLQPIYDKATKQSEMQAGWCFGLMLMETVINLPEQWYCKKDPEVAEGTIYWTA
jgi:hypothetical protein